jgi:serine protease Do
MVAGVNDGGPADKAQIKGGDIILKFNGLDVKDMHTLPRIVADADVGKQVPVVLWRDGKEVTVQATLAEKPDDATLAAADQGGKPDVTKPTDIAGLGIKIAPISQEMKDKYQLNADQKGVVITDVSPGSTASDRGLKPGDVIIEVQQGEVTSPEDVQKRVEAARKADRRFVLMLIQRQDGVQYMPLSLSRDKKPG